MPNNHRAFRYKIIVQGRATTIYAASCSEAVIVFINSLLRRQRIPSAGQLCVVRADYSRVIPEVHGVRVQLSDFLHRKSDRDVELRGDFPVLPEPLRPGQKRPQPVADDNALDEACENGGYIVIPLTEEDEAFNDRLLLSRLAEVRQQRKQLEAEANRAIPLDTPYWIGTDLATSAGVASFAEV